MRDCQGAKVRMGEKNWKVESMGVGLLLSNLTFRQNRRISAWFFAKFQQLLRWLHCYPLFRCQFPVSRKTFQNFRTVAMLLDQGMQLNPEKLTTNDGIPTGQADGWMDKRRRTDDRLVRIWPGMRIRNDDEQQQESIIILLKHIFIAILLRFLEFVADSCWSRKRGG